jgi:hypothetical protein
MQVHANEAPQSNSLDLSSTVSVKVIFHQQQTPFLFERIATPSHLWLSLFTHLKTSMKMEVNNEAADTPGPVSTGC